MRFEKLLVAFLLCTGVLAACTSLSVEELAPDLDPCDGAYTFTDTIATIMETNCALSGCHVSGFSFGDFTSYAGLKFYVDNGKFEERVLIARTMPPSFSPGPTVISTCEAQILQNWIDAGAPE